MRSAGANSASGRIEGLSCGIAACTSGKRQPPDVGGRQPDNLDRLPPCPHFPLFRRLGGPVRRSGEQAQRPALVGRKTVVGSPPSHPGLALPRRLLPPFGRASAPTMPQRVHTMRGPNVGTAMWSGQRSALSTASWWHCHQDTASDRTPLARMLPVQPATAGAAPSRYICLRFCFFENPLGTRNESLSGR
jgi:hypothetical protein